MTRTCRTISLHGLDLRALGYECERSAAGERATHVFLRKTLMLPFSEE